MTFRRWRHPNPNSPITPSADNLAGVWTPISFTHPVFAMSFQRTNLCFAHQIPNKHTQTHTISGNLITIRTPRKPINSNLAFSRPIVGSYDVSIQVPRTCVPDEQRLIVSALHGGKLTPIWVPDNLTYLSIRNSQLMDKAIRPLTI
jgi:hypothetical protein